MPSFKVTNLLAALSAAIQQNPILMNCVTGATLCSGSDFIAQRIEASDTSMGCKTDLRRFISAGILGGVFGGAIYPMAYAQLDTIWPGTQLSSVLQKSCIEIATVGIFVNSVSMSTRGLLAGRRREDVAKHVLREMSTVTLNDVKVWLPYNIVAFTFIPQFLRPSTTALMEAMWQTYISLRSHSYISIEKAGESPTKLLQTTSEDLPMQKSRPKKKLRRIGACLYK